ncbi:MAG: hypothetical protein GC191_16330 [Azospirillum sp.]|nr:hypothetical protein [Azospirillum sp.]
MRHEYYLILSIGAVVFVLALLVGRRRIGQARRRLARVKGLQSRDCADIRALARQTFEIKREFRRAEAARDAANRECGRLAEQIKAAEAVDRRLYVLDERRTALDLSWVATISHPDYARVVQPKATPRLAKIWLEGRRFVVWALDEAKARQKIEARLPESAGYTVRAVTAKADDDPTDRPAADASTKRRSRPPPAGSASGTAPA